MASGDKLLSSSIGEIPAGGIPAVCVAFITGERTLQVVSNSRRIENGVTRKMVGQVDWLHITSEPWCHPGRLVRLGRCLRFDRPQAFPLKKVVCWSSFHVISLVFYKFTLFGCQRFMWKPLYSYLRLYTCANRVLYSNSPVRIHFIPS